jgi:hypothetical protein
MVSIQLKFIKALKHYNNISINLKLILIDNFTALRQHSTAMNNFDDS